MGTNKLVNNWHKYCDELDRAALDEKTKPYAKREIIQLIHQIIKDNVLDIFLDKFIIGSNLVLIKYLFDNKLNALIQTFIVFCIKPIGNRYAIIFID